MVYTPYFIPYSSLDFMQCMYRAQCKHKLRLIIQNALEKLTNVHKGLNILGMISVGHRMLLHQFMFFQIPSWI